MQVVALQMNECLCIYMSVSPHLLTDLPQQGFIQDVELGRGQDSSRMIVVCTHALINVCAY